MYGGRLPRLEIYAYHATGDGQYPVVASRISIYIYIYTCVCVCMYICTKCKVLFHSCVQLEMSSVKGRSLTRSPMLHVYLEISAEILPGPLRAHTTHRTRNASRG